jgi:Holliday junction resolvase-like predicted endonuclease
MASMTSYQVAVAAEAFAAGLFAQAGCDVSVQYGANQPEYDLIVAHNNRFLKVSVKGTQDSGWGLNQSHKTKDISYHEAVDLWVDAHRSQDVYCLVQFKDVKLGECPRVYLATIEEIANALKKARNGHGETILWEHHTYIRGVGANSTDEIPAQWRFSQERVEQFLERNAIS